MTVWIAVQSPNCHSTNVAKNGKSAQEKQRYLCKNPECPRRTFILNQVVLQKWRRQMVRWETASVHSRFHVQIEPVQMRHYQPEIILLCFRAFLELSALIPASDGNGE